jgi:hypothetical protein
MTRAGLKEKLEFGGATTLANFRASHPKCLAQNFGRGIIISVSVHDGSCGDLIKQVTEAVCVKLGHPPCPSPRF